MSTVDRVPDPQDPVGLPPNATLPAPIVTLPAPVVTTSAGDATPLLSLDLVQVVREALATARAVSGGSEAGISAATGKSLVTATVSPALG